MRAFAFASAISLSVAAGTVEAAPARVASLNMCTDELLLMLAAPGQIASLTHLSHQPAEVPWWRQGRLHPRNDGSLLSVARFRPDLVLSMGGGVRDRSAIAARLGIRTLDLPFPSSLNDVERNVAEVAAAIGRQERGREVLSAMARLRASRPANGTDTIWLGGGGRTVAANGLAAQWMNLAGFVQRPLTGDKVGLEQLAIAPPAILLRSDYRSGQYSGEQRWLSHPLAGRAIKARTIRTDGRYWTCMGPSLNAEILRLRGEASR